MRSDRIRQLGRIADLGQRGERLGRDFLVELDVIVELGRNRAHQRFQLGRVTGFLADRFASCLVEFFGIGIASDLDANTALDQDFHSPVRQFEQLQNRGDHTGRVDRGIGRLVIAGGALGGQQDLLVSAHHFFERLDRFLAADEERNDHVREHDDVAQWQKGKCLDCRHICSMRTRLPARRDLTDYRDSIRPDADG